MTQNMIEIRAAALLKLVSGGGDGCLCTYLRVFKPDFPWPSGTSVGLLLLNWKVKVLLEESRAVLDQSTSFMPCR